jgi:hypothetical protein
MADENPLKHLPDVSDVAEEAVTLSTDPMKLVAKKTVNAYTHAALAAAVTVPLLASGGLPTISNIQARKPDENVPSQSQHTNTLEGAYLFEAAVTSGPMIQSLVPPAEYIIMLKSKK